MELHRSEKVGPLRTTVTFDPDVAHFLDGLQRTRGQGLSEVLNEVVRSYAADARHLPRFEQRTSDLGRPLVPIDCAGTVLQHADGTARLSAP